MDNSNNTVTFDDIFELNNNDSTSDKSTINKSKNDYLMKLDYSKENDKNKPISNYKIYYLDENNKHICSKNLGKYVLKNHQLTTLYYMLGLEEMIFKVNNHDKIESYYTDVGILSDKVGSGKSYVVMALINEKKTIIPKYIPVRDNIHGCSNITIDETKRNHLNTNILLVPHSLVSQWDNYLKDSGLKYKVISKSSDVFSLSSNTKFKGSNNIDDDKSQSSSGTSNTKKRTTRSKKTTTITNDTENKTENVTTDTINTDVTEATTNETKTTTKKKLVVKPKTKGMKKVIEEAKAELQEQSQPSTTHTPLNENNLKMLDTKSTEASNQASNQASNINYTKQEQTLLNKVSEETYADFKKKINAVKAKHKKSYTNLNKVFIELRDIFYSNGNYLYHTDAVSFYKYIKKNNNLKFRNEDERKKYYEKEKLYNIEYQNFEPINEELKQLNEKLKLLEYVNCDITNSKLNEIIHRCQSFYDYTKLPDNNNLISTPEEVSEEDEELNQSPENSTESTESTENENLNHTKLPKIIVREKTLYDDLTEKESIFLKNFGDLDKKLVEEQDLIIVSNTFYSLFALYLIKDNYTVNRLLIDECNAIKGVSLPSINRYFTWLISSSIDSLMTEGSTIRVKNQQQQANNPGYYYSYYSTQKVIFSTGFIMKLINELYKNINNNYKLYLINKPEYIDQSMKLPEYIQINLICKDSLNIRVLSGIVSNDVLKMLNAGDYEGIVNKMECCIASENNIIEMITEKYSEDLKVKEYNLRVALEHPKYDPKAETITVKNLRATISDLKNKIACIEERVKTVENCSICYDDFSNPMITPCCNNKFCMDCIVTALNVKNSCPHCRCELTIKQLIYIGEKKGASSTEETKKKKYENMTLNEKIDSIKENANEFSKHENMSKIFELINTHNTQKKILIFTEYESTLNTKVTSILDRYNLKYNHLKGTSSSINKIITDYKEGNTNVLLINSKYFGSGINLENTTDLIIIHKMNSDIEMQVIGRAQRYGRVGNLRIWKLLYENEDN